jgi:hypothetical protein
MELLTKYTQIYDNENPKNLIISKYRFIKLAQ